MPPSVRQIESRTTRRKGESRTTTREAESRRFREAVTNINVERASRNAARENRSTATSAGGAPQGGPVLVIAGALFVGYLYITQRLQGAYNALFGPPPNKGGLQPLTPGTQGTAVIPAPSGGGLYPRTFQLVFSSPYAAAGTPITISAADRQTCDFLVSSATLEATGSLSLAAVNVRAYCP